MMGQVGGVRERARELKEPQAWLHLCVEIGRVFPPWQQKHSTRGKYSNGIKVSTETALPEGNCFLPTPLLTSISTGCFTGQAEISFQRPERILTTTRNLNSSWATAGTHSAALPGAPSHGHHATQANVSWICSSALPQNADPNPHLTPQEPDANSFFNKTPSVSRRAAPCSVIWPYLLSLDTSWHWIPYLHPKPHPFLSVNPLHLKGLLAAAVPRRRARRGLPHGGCRVRQAGSLSSTKGSLIRQTGARGRRYHRNRELCSEGGGWRGGGGGILPGLKDAR